MANKSYDVLRGNILEQHRNGAVKTTTLTSGQAKTYREKIGKVDKKKTKEVRSAAKHIASRKALEKRREKSKKSLVKRISSLQPSLPKKKAQRSTLSRKMRIKLF
jgi:hypothetical protein